MPTLMNDLRYASRCLMKSPGFTLVAVITLALGIGANTAVFSLINAVLLRPLPYADSDRLVLVWESAPFFGLRDSPVAPANYVDWKARSHSFEEIGALEDQPFRLTGEGTPEVLNGSLISASALRALKSRAMLGRIFTEEDDKQGATSVVVINEKLWRRRFASDPNIIGRTVTLADGKRTIIGVLAPGSEPPTEYSGHVGEVWHPLGSAYTQKEFADRGRHNWMVIARLKPGVSVAQANAEMQSIGASLAKEYPKTNEEVGAFVAPLRDHFVTGSRRLLFILLGAVAFVLLIACANLANLLLSRAANRTKEVAVRTALGAESKQLARQFLCESLLLCAAGAALGLLVASTTFDFLARLAPAQLTTLNVLAVDSRVLAFTCGIAVATAVVFGMVPLIQVRKLDISNALKQGGRTLTSSATHRVRALLVCSEVALAFVLLIGAGLLIQTLGKVRSVDVGCRTDHLLTMRLVASMTRNDPAQIITYEREILRRVRAIPGVASAALTNHVPLAFKGDISGVGGEGRDPKFRVQCNSRAAAPGYFQTMGIPLVRGRDIQETDAPKSPYVVVINQTLANALWPGKDPIGRKILFESNVSVPVTGVVADIHSSGLDVPPSPEYYVSAWQSGMPADSLVIRTSVEPEGLVHAIQRAIWSVDKDQPITSVATMEQILDREVAGRRLQMYLLAAFAALALLLAAVGLYGVLSYLVGQQTAEIGVRMALGANSSNVLREIVGRGLRLTVIGIAIGIAGAIVLSRFVESFLYEVKGTDPATYVIVAVLLTLTAAIASYIPARRAMKVDPIVALHAE